MRLSLRSTLAVALVASAAAASPARAQFFTPLQSLSFALQPTNVATSFSFNKFDPTLGTLQAAIFTLSGGVTGTVKFESLDAAPSTVTANLGATVTLKRPDNSTIVLTIPAFSRTDNLTAYDGTIDFAGGSGREYTVPLTSANNSATLTSVADLLLFQGPGSIVLPITAVAASSASGPGNVITQFNTNVEATATLQYQYSSVVPEPSTYALMGTGLLALAGVARRRRAQG